MDGEYFQRFSAARSAMSEMNLTEVHHNITDLKA